MTKSNKNFLILGHTGIGKSSFINYAVDREVAKTGSGRPVNTKGSWEKHVIDSPFAKDETLTIFDSWGLESDQAQDWKALVNEKLQADWNEDIICGVIYCFSWIHRIQDFELDFLRDVLKTGYNVLIVLTNSDCKDKEAKKDNYYGRLEKELKDYAGKYKIVEVCNVNIEKLVGSAKKFGREEVLSALADFSTENLYRLYVNSLDKIYTEFKAEVEKRIKAANESSGESWFRPVFIHCIYTPQYKDEQMVYESACGALKEDFNALKKDIDAKIKRFGAVFKSVYNKPLRLPNWNFWDNIKSIIFFWSNSSKIEDARQEYIKSLKELLRSVGNNIDELKRHKERVYFQMVHKK